MRLLDPQPAAHTSRLAVHPPEGGAGSRVATAGRGTSTRVSRTVQDLVVGSDLSFEDRGMHALKGIEGTWALYSVG
jgi:hypothetical protein